MSVDSSAQGAAAGRAERSAALRQPPEEGIRLARRMPGQRSLINDKFVDESI